MIAQDELPETKRIMTLEQRRAYLKLPLTERRKILAEQAEKLVEHYESVTEKIKRKQWQGGDIVEF
jgi:hypothetical protein